MAFKHAGRVSDAVGRTGPTEFTVFAPGTDDTGIEGLVQRISDAVARSASVKLRAGVCTAPAQPVPGPQRAGSASPPLLALPAELFDRARDALR